MAYVYRHIRKDKNEVFYIGIGCSANYKRAFQTHKRNPFWERTASLTEFEVEILFDNLTWEEACEKEKEFIALYGRRDLGKGTLVNLTDGGDGGKGVVKSNEEKIFRSKKMKENHSWANNEKREKIVNFLKNKQKGEGNSFFGKKHNKETLDKIGEGRRKYILDLQTGVYYTLKEFAELNKMKIGSVQYLVINKNRKTKKYIYE